jgi:hypothetical protein
MVSDLVDKHAAVIAIAGSKSALLAREEKV